ncbi:hypothetical protein [Kibdelosporangium philippinense]|uniref:hypothetical protein n=1 Tax=Kibdelosporangium philippinense TaxID=211113 RepID=UPI0035E51F6B
MAAAQAATDVARRALRADTADLLAGRVRWSQLLCVEEKRCLAETGFACLLPLTQVTGTQVPGVAAEVLAARHHAFPGVDRVSTWDID